MNDPYQILIKMSISGLAAVIAFRLSNHKQFHRWLLLKTAPARGVVHGWKRELERVDWLVVTDVLLVAIIVGILGAVLFT